MVIGKINEYLGDVSFSFKKRNSVLPQPLQENGNPFLGEQALAHWKEMTSDGVDLHVQLSKSFSVDQIVLNLGERCHPDEIILFSEEKKHIYDRYTAETGKKITASVIELSVDASISQFIIEFRCDFSSVVLNSIEIYGSIPGYKTIYPTPSRVEIGNGVLSFASVGGISYDSEAGKAAADILSEKLEEQYSVVLEVGSAKISFVTEATIPKNAYRITVSEDGVCLSASDKRGMVMAAETLIKLAEPNGFPFCNLFDEPFCEFRGVHLYIPSEDQLEFTKKLIQHVFSPMGYNFIIMEVAGAMRFDSHPEINEALTHALSQASKGIWPPFPHGSVGGGKIVEKDTIRDLVAFASRFGISIVPEIQSLGHVQFMTQAHPDIAERAVDHVEKTVEDERVEDIPPSEFYAHSYCPSNPKSYEILFDLIDEIIDVFQPEEYVHMGHDEVYQIGICPTCKEKDPAELFAQDVTRIHDYLASKGLKMMIWSDMLQPVTKYLTPAAADRIPKDILMLDFIWYFHMDHDIEENLLAKDFDVLFGNLYSSHFPRFEKRIRSQGIRGGQISAWVACEEEVLGREGKLYDFLYTAQMLWSESYSHCNRYSYDKILGEMIPGLREKLRGVSYPSRSEKSKETSLLQELILDPSRTALNWEMCLDSYAQSLQFDHCCSVFLKRIPWAELEEVGAYVVLYEDGSSARIPLTYGGNICHWDRRQGDPFRAGYYRHNGYCGTWFSDGKRVPTTENKLGTVYTYEWINPEPGKKIKSVSFQPMPGCETQVCLFGLRLYY